MKRMWFLAIGSLMLVANGCEKKKEKPGTFKEATQPAKTAVESAQAAKEEFQKNMETRLKTLGSEISKFREKGRELKGEAQTNWDRKVSILETKRDAAQTKLTEVGHATAEAWKDLQKHAQASWDDLEKAFQEASR
jgi:hypothetical protein